MTLAFSSDRTGLPTSSLMQGVFKKLLFAHADQSVIPFKETENALLCILLPSLRISFNTKTAKSVSTFLSNAPRFQKEHCFSKVPRFRPFVLLERAMCRWSWEWSRGGMILTAENRSTRRKTCPVPLFPPQISHGLPWDRTRDSAVCKGYSHSQLCLKIQFCTAQWTPVA
jgi:hypothetical protein